MLSGRASARMSAIILPASLALVAWAPPRYGDERLPFRLSVLITVVCAVAAAFLLLDSLRIERAVRNNLRARRSGDPRKRRRGSSWSSVLGQAAAPQPSPSQTLGSDAPQAGAPARVASPSASADTRTGPVGEGSSSTRCIEQYSPTTLKKRAFAFDGTITSIGPVATNKYDDGHLDTASVTFTVNEWFIGGTAPTVVVDLMAPTSGGIPEYEPPAYAVGTRLLVSGEPRWGGAPLKDAIAWSCGGFTRYYEPSVAAECERPPPRRQWSACCLVSPRSNAAGPEHPSGPCRNCGRPIYRML